MGWKVNLIKTQYIQTRSTKAKPSWTIKYIILKMKGINLRYIVGTNINITMYPPVYYMLLKLFLTKDSFSGIYTQWNIIQPIGRMKLYHLQENWRNWRLSW
jgi:hypothetical protein